MSDSEELNQRLDALLEKHDRCAKGYMTAQLKIVMLLETLSAKIEALQHGDTDSRG